MKTINKNFRNLLPLLILTTVFSAGIAQNKDNPSDNYSPSQYKYLMGNDQYYLYEIADLNSYFRQCQLHRNEKTNNETGPDNYTQQTIKISPPLFLSKSPAANQYTFQVENSNRAPEMFPKLKFKRD